MQEIKLLSAAASCRDATEELTRLEIEKDFGDAEKIVWEEICRFYATDKEATHTERSILKERLKKRFPKEDHYEKFDMIVSNLRKVSIPNILDLVREVRLDNTSQELAVALVDGRHKKVDDLLPVYESLREGSLEDDAGHEVYEAPNYEELIKDDENAGKILVFPQQLNTVLGGGARRGNNIFLFARPEVGKTACAVTMTHGFLKQGLRVLYLGNEEPMKDIVPRIYAKMCNKEINWVFANARRAYEVSCDRGYLNLHFWQSPDGDIAELEKRVKAFKPDVILIDQLRNMRAPGDAEHVKYEILSIQLRKIGKTYNALTIALGQAGGEAEDKAILTMNDVYGSKTGIQGAYDVIIGAGATEQMKERGELIMNTCKNKLSGIHKPFKLRLDKTRSKVY